MQKILSIILLLALLGAGSLYAQTNIGTIDLEGSRVKLKGSIVGFYTSMQNGVNAATGVATGRRQHTPVTILRIADGSSPLLQEAAAANEVLKTVTISLDKPSARKNGYLQIRLTNAVITVISLMEGVSRGGQPSLTEPMEEISLSYENIQFVYSDTREVFKDNWEAR